MKNQRTIFIFFMPIFFAYHCHKNSRAEHHMHRQSFDELVKNFDAPERDAWQKPAAVLQLVARQLKSQNTTSPVVADLGAGSGYFSFRLLDAGYQVKALDVDDKFVSHLKTRAAQHPKRAHLEVRKAAIDNANLADGEVDVILSVYVYHHIEDRVSYFQRLRKSLRGKSPALIIIDFKDGDQPVGPPPHIKVPTEKIISELREAGYAVKTDAATLSYQTIFFATPENHGQ